MRSEPSITIVTPSYNQGRYIEETIESVLSQDIHELEYIIIDGGSTDESVEIIRSYADRLSYWTSEPDSGQSDAIAKGLRRATGDILTWLCSDDVYEPGTLQIALDAWRRDPTLDVLYGDVSYLYPDGTVERKPRIPYHYPTMLYAFNLVPQPSSFFRRATYERLGGLDTTLQHAMDYDLFLRMGPGARFRHVPRTFSKYRLHAASKTTRDRPLFDLEWQRVREKILGRPLTSLDRALWYAYHGRVAWQLLLRRHYLLLRPNRRKYRLAQEVPS